MTKFYIVAALLFVTSTASAATLSISPSSGTYSSGSTFTVNVMLNTSGAQIDGVDLRYLRFTPGVLQVVDSNPNMSGVQVTPGSLMPTTLTNTVDNAAGLITFSQVVAGGQHYTGAGTLLSITFQAVSGGTPSLSFDAVSGRTTDTNVASAGAEVLTSASSASFSITGAVTVTPTPVPTPSPTPVNVLTPTPSPTPVNVLTPQPTTPGTSVRSVSLSRTVYIGSKGSDVVSLQNFLIDSGYLTYGSNTGYFGPLTQSAVRRYQCDKIAVCSGSEATTGYGLVGARTRATLSGGIAVAPSPTPVNVVTPTPSPVAGGSIALTRTVYMGARGSDIISLQNFLIAKGYLSAGSNTGYFGTLTKAAVRKYQCAKMGICSGTEATTGYGLVGVRTRASMNQQ